MPPPHKRLSSNASIESDAVAVLCSTSDVSPRVTSDRGLACFVNYLGYAVAFRSQGGTVPEQPVTIVSPRLKFADPASRSIKITFPVSFVNLRPSCFGVRRSRYLSPLDVDKVTFCPLRPVNFAVNLNP